MFSLGSFEGSQPGQFFIKSIYGTIVTCCEKFDMLRSPGWILPEPDLSTFSSLNQIAFDWASHNWYYLDEAKESIFMCRVLNDRQICKVVINTKMSKPRGIALDPSAG